MWQELQDRIDELQAELQEYHNLGRTSQLCLKPSLSEDLESKSPGMESDPGTYKSFNQMYFIVLFVTSDFTKGFTDTPA